LKPNIVFIMADDMGYGDIGCYNPESKIPTPNMDRLAAEGIRFSDAHSCSAVCTPSRYGIVTGRYCWRSPLRSQVLYCYEPPLIEPNRLTVAGLLKGAGYHTACVGKWHLGLGYSLKPGQEFDFTASLPWPDPPRLHPKASRELEEKIDFSVPLTGGPVDLGFDYFFGTSGCSTSQPPYGFIEMDRFVEPPCEYLESDRVVKGAQCRPGMASPGWDPQEVDVVLAWKAVEYIEDRARRDEPFFLYLTPSAPHTPCCEGAVPLFARHRSEAGWRGDMVWLFDWVVGQVIDALERTGKAEETLVMVTSDNGAIPGDFRSQARGGVGTAGHVTYGHRSCGAWRGYKSHIWEGGHREPLIARWPGSIAPGSTSDELVGLSDFMATCAALVGAELPDNSAEDSVSILPALLGQPSGDPRRRHLVHHAWFGGFAVRQSHWKCIFGTRGSGGFVPPRDAAPVRGAPGQLYNMAEDREEEQNLWDERPDVVAELRGLLDSNRSHAADR
jgi:arylsulfatase A-like enzyme